MIEPGGDGVAHADLLAGVERLIAALSTHADPSVRSDTTQLLAAIDQVHRTALTRLMGAIQSMAGEAFVNRLAADPAIRLLLMSYDLLAVDRRLQAEEALDAVRGHLHAHGVDVELVDVLGGVVSVRLHGAPDPGEEQHRSVVHDLEAALSHGLLGFQELDVVGDADRRGSAAATFVPRDAVRRAMRPVYRVVCREDEVPPGTLRGAWVDAVRVLVARVDDEVFAVRNACGDGPLPLDFSTLEGTELRCSWHGCRYDLRTGARLDRPDAPRSERLTVLPVRVRDGLIEVVIGTSPVTQGQVGA